MTREPLPALLDDFTVVTSADAELPSLVCAEHLALLGARQESEDANRQSAGRDPLRPDEVALRPESGSGDELRCDIRGLTGDQPAADSAGTELLVQALSGLMAINGRDQGAPRRLGLDVASVAAGIVATQGTLAALIARSRGRRIAGVETSLLQAALLFLAHHLALATCDDNLAFPIPGAGPGPPFPTADGHRVELEMLTFDVWIAFWRQLGVDRAGLEAAWGSFVFRYLAASCALPETLHAATRRYTLEELRRIADGCGVAICRVRTYPELLAERGGPVSDDASTAPCDLRLEPPWTIAPGAARADRAPARLRPADAPLTGLRVVEVSSRLQGPLAGLLLGALGAEVVKVEPPGGDFGRYAPPLAGAFGAAYLAYNRGKQVVEIDYKRPADRAELAALIAGADVFLHNWRSGRAEKMGFDFPDLVPANPGLVYAHASGWGRTADEPSAIAGDFIVQAHAGCGAGLNPAGEPPFPSRVTLLDVTGGLLACEGILAGLYLRERTGRGCRVDTSLLGGALTLQAPVLRAIAAGREAGRRLGRPLWSILDQPIRAADGFLVVAASDAEARRRLAAACGVDQAADEDTLDELIAARLSDGPAADWPARLRAAGVPAAVIRTDLTALPRDPEMATSLERVENAAWMPAAPWRFTS